MQWIFDDSNITSLNFKAWFINKIKLFIISTKKKREKKVIRRKIE